MSTSDNYSIPLAKADWIARLRYEYRQAIATGVPLVLVFVGLELESRRGWMVCLGLLALISQLAWQSQLKRYRLLRNTPTSTIAAAAQGQVELNGAGEPLGGEPLYSELKRLQCLWCKYLVEERHKDEWRTVEHGQSSSSFMLRDRTGVCVVDPELAEVVSRHRQQWIEDGRRFTEWLLLPGDTLRVVGAFRTQSGVTEGFDARQQLNQLLADWKLDMPALLARFDADRDGQLSLAEWEQARRAAMQEVQRRRLELQQQEATHWLSRPQDGQLFLIANMPEQQLMRRYLLWSWGYLLLFMAATLGFGWFWQHPSWTH